MPTPDARSQLVDRMTEATGGAFLVAGVYLGTRLGLYAALAEGAATSTELAGRTGTDERTVREWLQQQTRAGVLAAQRVGVEWQYCLPAPHTGLLLDPDDPDGVAGTVLSLVAELCQLPRLLDAFRTGDGIPYADYGPDESTGQAMSSRGLYRTHVADWVGALPVAGRLRERGGRILDLGCGQGWSSITMAEALPLVSVDGVDLNAASIDAARLHQASSPAADRVTFEARDAAQLAGAGYDLVTMFEMVHDLARPVEALRLAREALAPHGVVLVADEPVDDEFDGLPHAQEARYLGWSVLHCLPASLVEPGSAATGTVMRPDTLRRFAAEAGFSRVDVLPSESPVLRLYLLTP